MGTATNLLTRLVLWMDSTSQKRSEAERHGVRYSWEKFWPPFYANFGQGLPDGFTLWGKGFWVCPEMYKARVGDVVPVLCDDAHIYEYQVTGISTASGSDHIVSPLQFDLEYSGRKPLPTPPGASQDVTHGYEA